MSAAASSAWASLPGDMVALIGWRVLAGDLLDYVRFRAVCPHWRSNTVCPRGRGVADPRFHPRRWMLLPMGHSLHPGDGKLRFFNLSTGAFVRARLPLLEGHHYSVLDSVQGLLLLHPQHDQCHSPIRLLHPFTGDVAELPPLTPAMTSPPHQNRHVHPENPYTELRGVASLSVGADGVATVTIVLSKLPRVAYFAITTDEQWSVSTWSLPIGIRSSISSHGNLYVLQQLMHGSRLRIFQIRSPRRGHGAMSAGSTLLLPPPELIATCPADKIRGPCELAECGSEILLIGLSNNLAVATRMMVYRVADLVPVTSFGGDALLLDVERSFSVGFGAVPAVAADTIVCRHPDKDYVGVGQYHLSTATWSRIADGGCGGRVRHLPYLKLLPLCNQLAPELLLVN